MKIVKAKGKVNRVSFEGNVAAGKIEDMDFDSILLDEDKIIVFLGGEKETLEMGNDVWIIRDGKKKHALSYLG